MKAHQGKVIIIYNLHPYPFPFLKDTHVDFLSNSHRYPHRWMVPEMNMWTHKTQIQFIYIPTQKQTYSRWICELIKLISNSFTRLHPYWKANIQQHLHVWKNTRQYAQEGFCKPTNLEASSCKKYLANCINKHAPPWHYFPRKI